MELSNDQKSLRDRLSQNRSGIIRLWAITASLHFITLLLGFGIWLIFYGIYIIARRITIYWSPARKWLTKTFDLGFAESTTTPSSTSKTYKILVVALPIVNALVFVAIGIVCIQLGINTLMKDGFLGQNLIYMLMKK